MAAKKSTPRASVAFIVSAVVVGINALISVVFALITVFAEQSSTSWYAFDRALVLFLAVVVVVLLRHRIALITLGWVLAVIQASDAVIGLAVGDAAKTAGPAVLAVLTALAMIWLTRDRPRTAASATPAPPTT